MHTHPVETPHGRDAPFFLRLWQEARRRRSLRAQLDLPPATLSDIGLSRPTIETALDLPPSRFAARELAQTARRR